MSNALTLASRLTERISIEQPVRTPDELGGGTVVWNELVSVFAEVTAISSGNKISVADRATVNAGYRVVIRHRDDVTANMRIIWRERTLSIHSLHETRAALEILTFEETV